jgi:hypothetical protein
MSNSEVFYFYGSKFDIPCSTFCNQRPATLIILPRRTVSDLSFPHPQNLLT